MIVKIKCPVPLCDNTMTRRAPAGDHARTGGDHQYAAHGDEPAVTSRTLLVL
jgi:hypothetical protein